ncbi:39S ribosomal protein L49, mitochondrial-like [Limulus polyphemus]|uniref:Large ribosomal subunit protein mL49 n=1 Tax=Limulus polyphemus TaxID=6850 RepID=A0ABM1BY19_LIMPO|nr:39S ribosomal protein L49, mitochondrial-like [Limulus polyphemus]
MAASAIKASFSRIVCYKTSQHASRIVAQRRISNSVAGKTENDEQKVEKLALEHSEVWAAKKSTLYTEVEEVKDRWHFVERLFPLPVIPKFPQQKEIPSPAGWIPPAELTPDLPYFISRTKNHMLPVYLKKEIRGPRFLTTVRLVEGNLWALEKDLKEHLERKYEKEITSQVHEVVGYVRFKGDYVEDVKKWLYEKGF